MQGEPSALPPAAASGETRRPPAPRVLAVCVPELSVQRVARGRERDAPLAVLLEGRVVGCNAEARASGVRCGDSGVQALAACARLALVAHDGEADRAALEALADALLAIAPAVEISAPDGLLLDASAAHLGGAGGADAEERLAARAVSIAAELGFRCRSAVASGRGPARALARFGGAPRPVPSGATAAALAALPLHALDLPEPVAARLRSLGVADAGALARLPLDGLADRFGTAGVAAWRLARGEDPTPLVPWVPERLPVEAIDLEAPVEAVEPLLFAVKRLCDRVATRLAGRGAGAARLEIALGLDPCGEERVTIPLASPSSAASRWLLVIRERLAALRLPGSIASVRLEVLEAAPAPPEQLALADRPEQLEALDVVLARIAARLGEGSAFAAEPVERHRPESAYRPAAFRGRALRAGRTTGSRGRAPPLPGASAAGGVAAAPPPRPTRLLPAPVAVVAEGEGGRLTAIRLAGRAHRVLAMSPPERLAGEWWAEPFDRDYRRVRLEGLGDCWVFRDRAAGRLWLHGFFD